MGLTATLAVLRVRALVVGVPGRPVLRLRAESAVRARGWSFASTPDDADLLLVCGSPTAELEADLAAVWAGVPAPRARRTVRTAAELPTVLDSAARVLGDDAVQRASAPPPVDRRPEGDLRRFGPARADWPAGLVLDVRLERGRVAEASSRLIAPEARVDAAHPAARAFLLPAADAARLLRAVAWPEPAARLDHEVDAVLAGREPSASAVASVGAAVARSLTLRWSLARRAAGLDVRGRLLALIAAAGEADPAAVLHRPDPAAVAAAVVGRTVKDVPLVVASGGAADG